LRRGSLSNLFPFLPACDSDQPCRDGDAIEFAEDRGAFAEKLKELGGQKRPEGGTRLALFLEQLVQYRDQPELRERIAAIVEVVLRVGDELLFSEDANGMVGLAGNEIRITSVLYYLLPKIRERERFEALRNGLEQSPSISTAVVQIHRLSEHDEKPDPGDEPLLDHPHRAELRERAVAEIRRVARDGRLLERPDVIFILYRWRAWGGDEDARAWLQEVRAEDRGLGQLPEAAQQGNRLDPKLFEPFAALEGLAEDVRHLHEDAERPARQREAAVLFLRGMEMLSRGLDTSDWLAWERE
jgi:predicted KAP-like P-loop ATPase